MFFHEYHQDEFHHFYIVRLTPLAPTLFIRGSDVGAADKVWRVLFCVDARGCLSIDVASM
jgi:hypothetical protein